MLPAVAAGLLVAEFGSASPLRATFEYSACLLQSRARPRRPSMNSFAAAFQDWSKSARLVPLWSNLALEDLRDRYRRTVLGLTWIIASFGLFVAVKVFVFGQLTKVSGRSSACT